MSYQHPPPSIDEDEIADASVVVTTILELTSTTARSHRSLKSRVAIFAGMMLVAGVVLMQVGSSYTTTPESLVVGTKGIIQCFPADGTFIGTSTTTSWGKSYPFETCYQLGDNRTYCWTKSYRHNNDRYYQCLPDGLYGDDFWHSIDAKYVQTPGVDPTINPKRCGAPCQAMQEIDDDDDDGYIPSN